MNYTWWNRCTLLSNDIGILQETNFITRVRNNSCNHVWKISQFNPKNLFCNLCGSWMLEGRIIANGLNIVEAGRKLIELHNK